MQMVLDASALLAWLRQEPGAEGVDSWLGAAVLSSVTWAGVLQKALSTGVEVAGLREDLQALGLIVEPFSAADADRAVRLRPRTRAHGLSLADRT